jgi:hypothetical protein
MLCRPRELDTTTGRPIATAKHAMAAPMFRLR